MLNCSKCKKDKSLDSFYFSKYKSSNPYTMDGVYSSACKSCLKKVRQGEIAKLPKLDKMDRFYRRNYGITLFDYDRILKSQNNVCFTCGSVNKNGRRLSVDHDHKTGKVRGILCNNCNSAIGSVEDNIHTLSNMIRYLKSFSN